MPGGLALTSQPDARAVFHTGRDRHLKRAFALHRAGATADLAWTANHAPLAATGRTGAFDQEEPLLRANLAGTTAGGAGIRRMVLVLGSRTGAGITHHAGRHPQIRLGTGERVGQLDLDGLANIAAGAATTGWTTAAPAHELAEHLIEDVAEAAACREVEPAAEATRPTALLEGGVAIAIVGRTLLIILQDVVGLVDLLELRLRLLVPRIAIGVKLHGEFSIGLLQVLRTRLPRHTQGGVVVLLRHFSPSRWR